MPVLQPAELWQRTGRYEIDELFKLDGPQGRRTHVLAMTHEEALTYHVARDDPLLPRAAEDPLPRPDQGARRAAAARRRAADARVHDEGLLLVRPRRGGPRRQLRAAPRGLRADLRPLRPALVRGRVRRRDDGRHRRPRVHGARARRARTRSRSRPATPPTSRSPPRQPQPVELPPALDEPREVPTPGLTTVDEVSEALGVPAGRGPEGDAGDRRRARDGAGAGPRRPPPERDQAAQRARRRLPPGDRPRRSRPSSGRRGSSARSGRRFR